MPASPRIAVISSSVDTPFTARLATDLRAAGWSVMDVAKTDLADVQHHLAQLQAAGAYIVILSQEALHSDWLNREIERVLELAREEPSRRVVPLRLMPLEMPGPLASLEPVDFATAAYDAALARLQEALGGADGLPAPEPALASPGKRKARNSRPRAASMESVSEDAATLPYPPNGDATGSSATPPMITPALTPAGTLSTVIPELASATIPATVPSTTPVSTLPASESGMPAPSSPVSAGIAFTPTTTPSVVVDGSALLPRGAPALASPLASAVPAVPIIAGVPDEAAETPETQITSSRFLRVEAPVQFQPAHDDVMFTVYSPGEVERRVWIRLLVYASRETRYALAQVAADAEARLAGQRAELRPLGGQRSSALARGARLTLAPSLPGFAFDPPAQHVKWEDGVQRHDFRLRALTAPAAVAARGSLRVFLGPLLLAEIPLAVMVREPGALPDPAAGYASQVARAYQRIFASFAAQDADLARAIASSAESLTDTYLRTALAASPHENRLRAIAGAEVFQLFWSERAARSAEVEREWRHALSLRAPRGFIRALHWSSQPGPVPPELRAIPFDALDAARAGLRHSHPLALLGRR